MKNFPIRILGSSKIGNLSKKDGLKLLSSLSNYEISYIDTAPTYPGSEKLIGKFLINHKNINWKIFTKFGRGDQSLDAFALRNSLKRSLINLNLDGLFALSIHNRAEVDIPNEVFELALELKTIGLIQKFGWCGDWRNLPLNTIKNYDYIMVPVNPFISNITEKLAKIDLPTIAINPFANFFWNYQKWNGFEKFYFEKIKRRFNPQPKYNLNDSALSPKNLNEMIKFICNFNSIEGIVFGSTQAKHISEIIESLDRNQKDYKSTRKFLG